MKIILSGINKVFDCSQNEVCTVVIENPDLMRGIVEDIQKQIDGLDGMSVLSEDNKLLRMDKYAEQIIQFAPLDMNKKTIINKISAQLQKLAVDDSHLLKTNELLTAWEELCMNLEFEMPVNIEFEKINVETLIKASGIAIADDYDSLTEKVIDYMNLVEEYECRKLFIFVNMRNFVSDREMQLFVDVIVARGYQVIMLEGAEKSRLKGEKRYLIDADMCEICYDNEEIEF